MKTLLVVVAACIMVVLLVLMAPPTKPIEVGFVDPYDFGSQTAYEVAEGLEPDYIPERFRAILLPSESGSKKSLYAIMRYWDLKRRGLPEGYRGANTSELLAFMGAHGKNLDDYWGLCAPSGFLENSVQFMAVVTKREVKQEDGTSRSVIRYGTRLKKSGAGCNWALVLKDEAIPATPGS